MGSGGVVGGGGVRGGGGLGGGGVWGGLGSGVGGGVWGLEFDPKPSTLTLNPNPLECRFGGQGWLKLCSSHLVIGGNDLQHLFVCPNATQKTIRECWTLALSPRAFTFE